MPRRFPIQLLSIVLFLGLIFSASADAGKKKPRAKRWLSIQPRRKNCSKCRESGRRRRRRFCNAQVVWPVQERGRFAGRSRARGEAPRKMRKYLTAGKPNSKNAAPATGCSGRAKPKVPPENHRSKLLHNQRLRKPLGIPTSHHFRRRRKKQIPRFARNDRWKWILCAGS